jgi:DNA-binding beta-propeller fold protein YncE
MTALKRRGRRVIRALVVRGLFALCLLAAVGAADAAAGTGKLIQKPRDAGCLSVIGFCAPAIALDGAAEITISPDGQSAYVASRDSSAVVVFDRSGGGDLIQKPGPAACLSDSGAGRCRDGTALSGAASVAVSPDGKSAYVASEFSDAVAVFDRKRNGRLIQKAGTAGCISDTGAGPCVDGKSLQGANSVTVSPDGENVYVTSSFFAAADSNAVAVFDRAADGTLTQKPGTAGCISDTGAGPCADGTALDGANSVTVSPDGQNAYVTSDSASTITNSDSVTVFDRAGDGTLSEKPGTAGCISDTGAGCVEGTAFDAPTSVAVSPDGKSAYVTSKFSSAVDVFDRRRNGRLVQKPGTAGCISGDGAGPCVDGTALRLAGSVAVSPDGRSAYVASASSDAVAVFDRASNGTLAQKRGTAGCIKQGTGARRCVDGEGLDDASSVALSPDGQHVYTTATLSDAVALFDREPSRSRRRTR